MAGRLQGIMERSDGEGNVRARAKSGEALSMRLYSVVIG
jgi:hypothetical protein